MQTQESSENLLIAVADSLSFSVRGAMQFWRQDWRHQHELLTAARAAASTAQLLRIGQRQWWYGPRPVSVAP
jgi:hypothetical protein